MWSLLRIESKAVQDCTNLSNNTNYQGTTQSKQTTDCYHITQTKRYLLRTNLHLIPGSSPLQSFEYDSIFKYESPPEEKNFKSVYKYEELSNKNNYESDYYKVRVERIKHI